MAERKPRHRKAHLRQLQSSSEAGVGSRAGNEFALSLNSSPGHVEAFQTGMGMHPDRLKAINGELQDEVRDLQRDAQVLAYRTRGSASQKHEDAMDVSDDDDGGVKLILPSDTVAFIETGEDLPNADLIPFDKAEPRSHGEFLPASAYWQSADLFIVPGAQLWKLPVDVVQGSGKKLTAIVGHVGHVYHQSCQLLRKNWQCDPINGLPEMFHESTPYSLALLLMLRRMCSNAKGDLLGVHALLHSQWQIRVAQFGIEHPGSTREYQTANVADVSIHLGDKLPHCETHIQENIYGITLQDAARAVELIKVGKKGAAKEARRAGRPTAKQGSNNRRMEQATSKAEKQIKKVKQNSAIKEEKQQREVAGPSRPRGGRLTAAQELLLSLRDVRQARAADQRPPTATAQKDNDDEDDAMEETDEPEVNGDYALKLSKKQKQDYKLMSEILNTRMNLQEPTKRRRNHKNYVQKIIAGSRSGNLAPLTSSLPSERFDFNTMPSLHDTAQEGEIALGFGKLGLGRVPRDAEAEGDGQPAPSISQADNAFFRR